MRKLAILAFLGSICVLTTSEAALAQSVIVLQLQQRLIAERRLADDREIQILREQETVRMSLQRQLAAAQGTGAAARRKAASLTTQLNDVKRREKELLTKILQRDPASQILIADLETELSQMSTAASPAVQRAISEFGTGNRTAAWPRIEALAKRGSAREKRIAARLRMIMFNYQDAGVTPQDVRDRWLEAVSADPSNSLALAALATAQQYLGDIPGALDTLARASGVSTSPAERHLIAWQRAAAGYGLQDPELMVTLLGEQLEATRRLQGTGIPEVNRKWMEAQTLVQLAGFLMNVGKNAKAAISYEDAANRLDELKLEAPTWRFVEDALAGALVQKGYVEFQLNRLSDASASFEKGIALLKDRIAIQPADSAPAVQALAQAYTNMCNVKQQQSLVDDAVKHCGKALELQKKQPKSAARDFLVAGNSVYIARMMISLARKLEAKAHLRYAVELWSALAAMDPVPIILAGRADALTELAALDDTVCWREVAAAWKALADTTALNDFQKRVYLRARVRGRSGDGCDLQPAAIL